MKTFAALLVLSFAGVCVAQQPAKHVDNFGPCSKGEEGMPKATIFNGTMICRNGEWIREWSDPAPLKCGKYEHVEHHEGPCGPPPPDCLTCLACWPVPPDKCAPDLHTVTEKEWQHLEDAIRVDEQTIRELMARLKKPEEKPQPQKHVTACARRPDSAVFWTDGRAALYADGIVADRDRMWFDSLPTCTEKDFAIWKKSALNSAVAP